MSFNEFGKVQIVPSSFDQDEKQFKKEKKKQASSLRAQLELQWLAEKLEKERQRDKSKEVRNEAFQLQQVREAVELERQQIQEEMRKAVRKKETRQQMKIEQGRDIIRNENQIRSKMKQQQIEDTLQRRNNILKKKQEELQAKIYLKDYNTLLRSQKRRELLENRSSQSRNDLQRQMLAVQGQHSLFKESVKVSKKPPKASKKVDDQEEESEEEEEESEEEDEDEEEEEPPSALSTARSNKSKSAATSKSQSPRKGANKSEASKSPSTNYIKPTEEYLSVMKYAGNAQELRRCANEVIVNFLKDEERAEQHRREFLAIVTDPAERGKMEKTFEMERKKERSALLQLNKTVNEKIQQMYFQLNQ